MKSIKVVISFCFFLMLFFLFIFQTFNVYAANNDNQTIENGIYEIETILDSNKVIDISEASTESGANVQIWGRCNVLQQRFEFTYLGNGYYIIKGVKSGKVLDVMSASKNKGTNVWQYEENNTDAQKWKIEKNSDGNFYFISKCNNLYLTITNSRTNDGTNIEVNEFLRKENQKFKLKKIETVKGSKLIEDGIYTISTALSKNKVLDISEASLANTANLQIWEDVNVPQQKFYLKFENGYYTFKNLNSGKMVDVSRGDTAKGTNVWQYEENNTDAQKWVITKTTDGYYNIISKSSGIYLEVLNGVISNGANVQINLKSGEMNQKFIFKKLENDNFGIIKNDIYEISSKLSTNMILDISEGSIKDGANVQIWADSNVSQQKFEVSNVGAGLYKIISKKSGKALTVNLSGTSNSSNVYQSTYKESSNQLWKIIESEIEGYFYIVSIYNGKYLDVSGGFIDNGTNINVYNSNKTSAQKFAFEKRIYGIDVSHWQSEIDFKTLKNSEKIDFIIIRAGQGSTIKDRQFERNYVEAKKYGIPAGVYLYAKAQTIEDAKKEANNLVEWLKGKKFEMPIFYDIEEHEELDKSVVTSLYMEFYNIIKKAGFKPGLYASKYYLMYKINLSKIPEDSCIWLASYGKNTGSVPNDVYKYNGKFDIWQYTSVGSIPGIQGNVDCNIIYKKK